MEDDRSRNTRKELTRHVEEGLLLYDACSSEFLTFL
jgi:hypothetical protein